MKAGVQNIGAKCQSDNRIRVSLQDNSTDYHFYHRTVLNKDKYKFGLLGVYDIGKNVLQKNNLLFAYTHNDQHSVYLRAENDGYRRANPKMNDPASMFDNIIVDYVNNIDSKSKAAV